MPNPVEGIVRDPTQFGARLFRGAAEPLHLVRRVQPGIAAENLALFERRREPLSRWLLHQMMDLERARIDLGGRLQCVPPIGKQRCVVAQHDREAGRPGKAGQPRETLTAGRHVFPLMLIGARHDEPVESARRQFLPKAGETLRSRQPSEIVA